MRFKKHRLLSVIAAALTFLFILILNEVYYDSSEVLIDEKWEQIIDKRHREIVTSRGLCSLVYYCTDNGGIYSMKKVRKNSIVKFDYL